MSGDARRLLLLQRKRAIMEARRDLVAFTCLMMSDPDRHEDPAFSIYQPQKFHRVIGAALEEVEARNFRRLMINVGPRFGKTTLASAMFPAWYIGRHPDQSIIVATYNEHYSWDLGRKIQDIMRLPQYAQVFPGLEIKKRAEAVNRIETTKGGVIFMVGRGSAITGRGAHVISRRSPRRTTFSAARRARRCGRSVSMRRSSKKSASAIRAGSRRSTRGDRRRARARFSNRPTSRSTTRCAICQRRTACASTARAITRCRWIRRQTRHA
jgi:hypothetical protein